MSQTTVRIPNPLPDNDDVLTIDEPAFRRASASDRVWRALRRLRQGRAASPDTEWSADELAAWTLYAPLARGAETSFVFAQIGQSLDGRIATENGDARNLSGRDGLKHLHRCRAMADAVVIGVNTALADNPRLTVRFVDGCSPARVVIDPQGRLPDSSRLLRQEGRKLVIQACGTHRPPEVEVVELESRNGRLDPQAIVAALAERGLRRILVEGGGSTIGRFLDAGALDRLHVAISPMLIGAGPSGLCASSAPSLSQALRPRTGVYSLGTDIVFDCALERRAV